MSLTIESPGLKVGAKLQKLITSKFGHLEKLYNRIEEMEVVLRKKYNDQQKYFDVSAKVLVPGKTLFAGDQGTSFELALQKVVSDLEQQVHKHKEELEAVR